MRCPDCSLTYPNDKQQRTYHPKMFRLYIRHDKEIKNVGWYCIHCQKHLIFHKEFII